MPLRVAIDAGHGGHDSGAIGHFDHEEHFTLLLSHLIYSLCEHRSISATLTRQEDSYPSLYDRVALANRIEVAAFLSVHFNASSSPLPSGTQMLYWKTSDRAQELAQLLLDRIAPLDGQTNEQHERLVAMPDANFRRDSQGRPFAPYVLKYTRMPAVILEIEFGTNPTDAATMRDPRYLLAVAKATVDSLKEWM